MIQAKSVIILGVGFGLGYATCLSQNEDIREAATTFKQFLHDEALKDDVKRREQADAEAKAKENTAWGDKDKPTEPPEAEVVEEDDKTETETTTEGQGETP